MECVKNVEKSTFNNNNIPVLSFPIVSFLDLAHLQAFPRTCRIKPPK